MTSEKTPLYPSAPGAPAGGPPRYIQPSTPQQWNTELFSCGESMGTCLYAWFCMQCAMASARTEYDTSNWIFNFCILSPAALRNIVREGYGIEGTWLGDALIPFCCGPCALTQVLSEVRKRGPISAPKMGVDAQWTNGLCSCCEDPVQFLFAYLFPACAAAYARNQYDTSNFFFNCCCVPVCLSRNVIREGYGIEGDCVGDICIPMWCQPCAITQFAREVKVRGPQQGSRMPVQGKMV